MSDPLDPNSPPAGFSARPPRRIGRWLPMVIAGGAVVMVAGAAGYVITSMKDEQRRAAEEPDPATPADASALIAGMPLSGEISALRPPVVPAAFRTPGPEPAAAAAATPQSVGKPAAPQNDLEAAALRREWEEYYRRRDALKWERYESTQAALKSGLDSAWGGARQAAPAPTPDDPAAAAALAAARGGDGVGGAGQPPVRPGWLNQGPSDPARSWLAASVMPTLPRYALMKGDNIPCRIEQDLSSEIGGQFTAIVTRPVADGAGRPLVPAGTRLVGSYDQNTGYGQERLPAGFTDMVFPPVGPEGRRDTLALHTMPVADGQGRAGFKDRVDNHTGRVLFSAVVSLLAGSAGSVASQALGGGIGGTLAGAAGSGVGVAGRNTVGRGVNTSSTIEIRRGYQCNVQLTQHVPFPGVWVDGVGHVPE